MKPYQRENSGPQQQQQQQLKQQLQQQQQGVMQNPNNHRFTPNQQLQQQQQQQQIQQHQQQQLQQQQLQQQQNQNQQQQQQPQQQQLNQQPQQAQNAHEHTPSRVNTSQGGGATATQGPISMYTGPSGATQGVFPSKPPGNISISGNQGQPRPQSAVYPPSSSSPRMVSQVSGYPVPAPRSVPTSMAGPGRSEMRQAGTHYQYYPSLSGSETDVSTSTENLTQVGPFIIYLLPLVHNKYFGDYNCSLSFQVLPQNIQYINQHLVKICV